MEYYSAIKTNEILPFVTTWVDLEGIILSERVRQGKINIVLFHPMWNLKKQYK